MVAQKTTALISARFDKGPVTGPVEKVLREVHKMLQGSQYDVRMVEAGWGDNFGDLTVQYLNDVRKTNGLLLAACTRTYGEKGRTPFGSFQELRYCVEKQLSILPMKFDPGCYPPQPPCGSSHQFDPDGLAEAYVQFAIRDANVWLDCIGKRAQEIATDITQAIDRHMAQQRPLPGPVQQPQVMIQHVPAYRLLRTNAPCNLTLSLVPITRNNRSAEALQTNQLYSQAVGMVGQCNRAGMPSHQLLFLHGAISWADRLQVREDRCWLKYMGNKVDMELITWQRGFYNQEIARCNSELYRCIKYAQYLMQHFQAREEEQPPVARPVHQEPPVARPVHQFDSVTLSLPTSCGLCDDFLWGFSGQGAKCAHCLTIWCHSCKTSVAASSQQCQRAAVQAQHGPLLSAARSAVHHVTVTIIFVGQVLLMPRMGGGESEEVDSTGNATVGSLLAKIAATKHGGEWQDSGLRLVARTEGKELELDDPLPAKFELDIVPAKKPEDRETELRRKMFVECDKDHDGVLLRPDWSAVAAMLDFDAADEKYKQICDALGVDYEQGISEAKFDELLTDVSLEELESMLQIELENTSGARCPRCNDQYTRTVESSKSGMWCDLCKGNAAELPHMFECRKCDHATCSVCARVWAKVGGEGSDAAGWKGEAA